MHHKSSCKWLLDKSYPVYLGNLAEFQSRFVNLSTSDLTNNSGLIEKLGMPR